MPPKRPPAEPPAGTDLRERLLFGALDIDRDGVVSREEFLAALWRSGLKESDPRLATVLRALKRSSDRLHYEAFRGAIEQSVRIVEQVIQGRTAIPDFEGFSKDIEALFEEARGHDEGTVAAYIPQLARANPEGWGLSLCTVDGQRLQLGDSTARFTAQSTSKPMNYALALEERGSEEVHRYVGREPSGHGFNELKLNREGRPHNPMINAGAIMTCALVRPDLSPSDRFDWLLGRWSQACGGARVGFDNAVYLSERETADRNFALAYFMREHKAFPPGTPPRPDA
jgi:glutaminase